MSDIQRPIETAPRDGTLIRLRFGNWGGATAGWWDGKPELPWSFIDRQTGPASHFINRAVGHLPTHWAPMDSR